MSERAAAGHFGIDRKTVSKILKHSVPPGYRREPVRPKLEIINQILEEDKSRIKKQRHTARRIYERLRDEHGFTGGITIVTDYVRERRRRLRGRCSCRCRTHRATHRWTLVRRLARLAGLCAMHYFAMALPHSDAFLSRPIRRRQPRPFAGHVAGFAFFGKLYDNTTIAVARILGDGKRQRTRTFAELQSHYLFEDRTIVEPQSVMAGGIMINLH